MNDDRTPTGELDAAVPGSPLTPLGKLHNYRIVEGDPDVRGWEVLGSDRRKIGEVDDLLVDTQALRARYLDVTLDLGLFGESGPATGAETARPPAGPAASAMAGLAPLTTEVLVRATLSDEENRLTQEHHHGSGTRHVLIPIGYARLDEEHDRVLVEGLRSADVLDLPDYDGKALDRDYEAGLRRRFDQAYAHSPESDFYAHDLYDEDRFYGSRRRRPDRGQAVAPQEEAALPVRGRS